MGQAPVLDPVHARAPVFTPRSGPVGTDVTLETRDLPAVTPIYLGIGATRSSFEVLKQLVTDEFGEMSEVVQIPSWATTDRTHYFVLVDVYFRPLAVSGVKRVIPDHIQCWFRKIIFENVIQVFIVPP